MWTNLPISCWIPLLKTRSSLSMNTSHPVQKKSLFSPPSNKIEQEVLNWNKRFKLNSNARQIVGELRYIFRVRMLVPVRNVCKCSCIGACFSGYITSESRLNGFGFTKGKNQNLPKIKVTGIQVEFDFFPPKNKIMGSQNNIFTSLRFRFIKIRKTKRSIQTWIFLRLSS